MPQKLALHFVQPASNSSLSLIWEQARFTISLPALKRSPDYIYLHETANSLSYLAGQVCDVTPAQLGDFSRSVLTADEVADQRAWPSTTRRRLCYERVVSSSSLNEMDDFTVLRSLGHTEEPLQEHLYVMAYEGDDSCCRIGSSANPEEEARQLSSAHAYRVYVTHTWWSSGYCKDDVYRHLSDLAVFTEEGACTGWFWISPVEAVADVARTIALSE